MTVLYLERIRGKKILETRSSEDANAYLKSIHSRKNEAWFKGIFTAACLSYIKLLK